VAAAAAVALVVTGVVLVVQRTGGSAPATPANPRAGWVRLKDLPVELEGAAVASWRGELWVAGGVLDDEARSKTTHVYVYNPKSNAWRSGPDLPRPISHAALVVMGSALVFLGGWVQDGGSRDVLRLDHGSRSWVRAPSLPSPRVSGAAAWDGTRILFAGGTRPDGTAADEVWASVPGGWAQIGRLHHGRQKLAAVSNSVDTVWFLGGRDQQTNAKFGDIDRYTEGRVSSENAVVDPPRDSAAAVRIDGIGNCLIGGQLTSNQWADWWCDQPNAAASLPKLDPQRAGLGAARIGRTIYVVGGYGARFDGTNRLEAFTPPAS
jgi:Kelch motif